MYIAILGRQPALGMSELEHLYGARDVRWFSSHTAVIATPTLNFEQLGGSLKAGRIVGELPHGDWRQASTKIVQLYIKKWSKNEGKITLGISAYGFDVSTRDIQKTGLILKQKLKNSPASLRLIPNQETALNTAASHHNKLGLSANKVELLVVRAENGRIIIAESIGAQNITQLARRDQGRPKRDAFVGMLPPKLAQIMVNMVSTYSSLALQLPSQGRSMGGDSASPWRLARPDGDIPSNGAEAQALQTQGVVLEVSSQSTSSFQKHLQPEPAPARVARGGAAPASTLGEAGADRATGPADSDQRGADEDSSNDGSGKTALRLLDPFCGTGVVLQEAALMGYDVYGTDLSEKMIDYSKVNLDWLTKTYHRDINATLHQGDAMESTWQPPIDAVVCESYLGQPFSAPPSPEKLQQVMKNCDYIISSFLKNIGNQIDPGTPLCIAVPAWRDKNGHFSHLPLIRKLEQLGYSQFAFKNVNAADLLYYREDQVVARQLLALVKA